MDWALSPWSRLLTIIYIILGAPIMFIYLRTTGSLSARAMRFIGNQISCWSCNRRPASILSRRRERGSGTFYSTPSSNSLSSMGSRRPSGQDASGSTSGSGSSKRSKWKTRGNSSGGGGGGGSGKELMQLRPTGSFNSVNSAVIDYDVPRPAVAIPILGCVLLLCLYLVTGAVFIAETQGLAYREAFYMCFVTLCTVGLGGEVLRRSNDLAIILVVIYIFVGVTLLSTTLHIVHGDVYVSLKQYRSLKNRKSAKATALLHHQGGSSGNSSQPDEPNAIR